MSNPYTIKLPWYQIEEDSRALAAHLRTLNRAFSAIIAISRGGLIPATIVAQELAIRHVSVVNVISYEQYHGVKKENIILRIPLDDLVWDSVNTLVIDDLADTGDTLGEIRKHFPKSFYATLYAKPQGACLVNYQVRYYDQHTWLQFPWEAPITVKASGG